MEKQIMILNVLAYTDKKTKEGKIRVGYIFFDKDNFQDSGNFKGYSEQSAFFDNQEIFNKIPKNFIFTPILANFDERQSRINPLRKTYVITSISTKDQTIDL